MRLVTWNCNKDRRHTDVAAFSLLRSLQPDVAAIQECIQSDQPNSPHCTRLGRTPKYDIAVLSNDAHELMEHEQEMAEPRYFLPVRIKGALEFNLLAVWAQKEPTYVDAVWNGFDAYASFLAEKPSVVLGDFNVTPRVPSNSERDYHRLAAKLSEEFGLVSAYHEFHNATPNHEKHATYYHNYKADQPFHLDYCFVPRQWVGAILDVNVGNFAEWQELSDHCPVMVDLKL